MNAELEIPRDRWGRPLIIPPEGGKPIGYTRCTTFVKALEDTYNLTLWKQRQTARGLMLRPDLQMAVASTDPDDKAKLNKICEAAMEAAASSASATIGTALHALTEKVDRGEDLGPVPADYLPDLKAYEAATGGLDVVEIETFGVHDGLKVGGTWDRVYRWGDNYYIGDVKTGSIDYAINTIAMQLAVYARCQRYTPDGVRHPGNGLLNTDKAIIVHLPAGTGTCRLVWVNIAAGWGAVQLAARVRDWRARKDLSQPFAVSVAEAPAPPQEVLNRDVSAALISAIGTAETYDDLNNLWEQAKTIWTDKHTEAVKARQLELAENPF